MPDKYRCKHGVYDGDGCPDCDIQADMDRDLVEDPTNYDRVVKTAMRDIVVRTSANENNIRRRMGEIFEASRKAQKISIRELAKRMKTSVSQVQRVLHKQVGGSLTLSTIVRACDVLGVEFSSISFKVKCR